MPPSGFGPLRLSRALEPLISRRRGGALERRYWRFRYTRHYGGNAAGDVVGCNLRCAFCWAWRYAFKARVGEWFSPRRAAGRIAAIARSRGAPLARLTGGEPTLAWEHTAEVARLLAGAGLTFILETNGILIGAGWVEAREVARLRVYTRISIKAPTPEAFEAATGAAGWALDLQLRAVERLVEEGLEPGRDFRVAVVYGTAPPHDYKRLLERLASIHPAIPPTLEVEEILLYPHVLGHMRRRGFKPHHAAPP